MRMVVTTNHEDIGMKAGNTGFMVEIYDTKYSEKDMLKAHNMCWRPSNKSWWTSGHMKATVEETEKIIVGQYKRLLPLEETNVVRM